MIEFRGSLLTRTTVTFAIASSAIVLLALFSINIYIIEPLMHRAANNQAAMIELAANTYFELPFDRRAEFELEVLVNHGLLVSTVQQDMPLAIDEASYFAILRNALAERFGAELAFLDDDEHYWINVPNPIDDSLELQIGFSSELPYLTAQIIGVVVVLVAAAIAVVASYITTRRIARPLQRASSATEQFRGTNAFERLPVEGPKEIRTLAANLNQMAHDISELLENRTALLAGISHDIRTPLTRMRLAIEINRDELDPKVAEQLSSDLSQMDSLVENALEYARGTQEPQETVPFDSFLTSLVDGVAAGTPIEWQGEREIAIALPPTAFSRVVTNLVANALEYAEGASLLVVVEPSNVTVHVRDQGSGIPTEEREKVFRPFYRIDSSRGGESQHSGLGLAIVKQICDNFGWTINVATNEGGGTDVAVRVLRE